MQLIEIEQQIIDEFVKLKGKKVLEVGCGDGRLSSFIASKAGCLVAIDPDGSQIEIAKNSIQGADFRIGSGESLEFPADSFDLVFFGFSLHHQEGNAALREAKRVLKPGGDILIIEPTIISEYTQLVAVFEKDEPALLAYAQKAIARLCTSVSRREEFVVHHFFDSQEKFLDHYFTSYGKGSAVDEDRRKLLEIIGDKRFHTPICVEDECVIILVPE